MSVTDSGARFVFGSLADTGFSFVVQRPAHHHRHGKRLSPSSTTSESCSGWSMDCRWVLSRTMRTSGAESLAAVANLFLGMTESALIVKPYLERMTRSELFLLMTVGMATVAGSVMLAYVENARGRRICGATSPPRACSPLPPAILIAKVMIPRNRSARKRSRRLDPYTKRRPSTSSMRQPRARWPECDWPPTWARCSSPSSP